MKSFRLISRFLFVLTLIVSVGACASDAPWVEVKGERFKVTIADDDQSRARGLMFVDELPDDQGMLFVFRREAPRAFWMRNTRIPLDIIYLDAEFQVVTIIKNAKPCRTQRCPSYPSVKPAQYVLELNGGMSDQLGLEVGDAITVGHLNPTPQ
ncbi:MAG TPA: DUF192 domain-containing protein [Wenzhouxiangella sp.]